MAVMEIFLLVLVMIIGSFLNSNFASADTGIQPLSKIAIHKATAALRDSVSVKASPYVLGLQVASRILLHLFFFFFHLIF